MQILTAIFKILFSLPFFIISVATGLDAISNLTRPVSFLAPYAGIGLAILSILSFLVVILILGSKGQVQISSASTDKELAIIVIMITMGLLISTSGIADKVTSAPLKPVDKMVSISSLLK